MIVKQILSLKPATETVVTIHPDATLADAAQILSARKIGAVVVSADGISPDGILSERDIVRLIASNGAAALDAKVSLAMTRAVKTCKPGDSTREVLERMTEGRFRHLPVIDETGAMIGLVSIGDAVSARLKQLQNDREAMAGMIMGN